MGATGATAATLTNLFGGATNNEGLGLFSLTFDWQYVRAGLTCCIQSKKTKIVKQWK